MNVNPAAAVSHPVVGGRVDEKKLEEPGLKTVKKLRKSGWNKFIGGIAKISIGISSLGVGALLGMKMAGLAAFVLKIGAIAAMLGVISNPVGLGILCGVLVVAGLYLAIKGYQKMKEGKAIATGDIGKRLEGEIQQKKEHLGDVKEFLTERNAELDKKLIDLNKKRGLNGKPGVDLNNVDETLKSYKKQRNSIYKLSPLEKQDFYKEYYLLKAIVTDNKALTQVEATKETLEKEIQSLDGLQGNQEALDDTAVNLMGPKTLLCGGVALASGPAMAVFGHLGLITTGALITVAEEKGVLNTFAQFLSFM